MGGVNKFSQESFGGSHLTFTSRKLQTKNDRYHASSIDTIFGPLYHKGEIGPSSMYLNF